MRRDKRKAYKTEYLKNGRKLLTERRKLWSWHNIDLKDDEDWPISWQEPLEKPEFYGIQVKLEPIPAIKESEYAGLAEAVDASSHYLTFSSKELRFCNLKKHWCRFNDTESILKTYFNEQHQYIKGRLDLGNISERKFNQLSKEAQEWFYPSYFDRTLWNGDVVRELKYIPTISQTLLTEVHTKLYIYTRTIMNSERASYTKWLEIKLHQDCLQDKIYHQFFTHKRDSWFFEHKKADRYFTKRTQKLKKEWNNEAEEFFERYR